MSASMRGTWVVLGALGCASCGSGGTPAPGPAAPVAATAPQPAADPAATPRAPTAPAPAAAADPDPAVPLAAPALGLPPAPVLPPIPDPRTADAWLSRITARFEPAPDLDLALDARYAAAIRALAGPLVGNDPAARTQAVDALGRFGVATALHLPAIIRELRAPAVARNATALADAEAALRAAGADPETVQWGPDVAQLEGTVAVLARQLIDGTPDQQAEAARLLGEIPKAVVLFLPRAGRDILDEPGRDALLAAQRRIWATGDLARVWRWLAVRNARCLLVDREVLGDPPAELRDRDYVVPDLVLNNLAGELLCDFVEVGDCIVVWRKIRRLTVAGGQTKPVRIGKEFAVPTGTNGLILDLLRVTCPEVQITMVPGVHREAPAKAFVRAIDATEAVHQVADQLGLSVTGDAEHGFTLAPK